MALAILQLGDVELRTTDQLTCRTLFRMMRTAVTDDSMSEMVDPPRRPAPEPAVSTELT